VPTSTPAEPFSSLANPTSTLAEQTSTLAEPISSPADPTNTPAEQTSTPAEPTSTLAKPIYLLAVPPHFTHMDRRPLKLFFTAKSSLVSLCNIYSKYVPARHNMSSCRAHSHYAYIISCSLELLFATYF
jgi:hypothetical protein